MIHITSDSIGLDQGEGATRRCCNLCSSDEVPERGWEFNTGYCDRCVMSAPRVGGTMPCKDCGREYRQHPMAQIMSNFGEPYLHRLCDGRLVKL